MTTPRKERAKDVAVAQLCELARHYARASTTPALWALAEAARAFARVEPFGVGERVIVLDREADTWRRGVVVAGARAGGYVRVQIAGERWPRVFACGDTRIDTGKMTV